MAAKQNVKRRIVDAAWELFYEKGYDDTTVDDIIRLSETSKGSFYYYFSSKDSLLDTLSTILDENYAKLEDELDPEMNSFDNDLPKVVCRIFLYENNRSWPKQFSLMQLRQFFLHSPKKPCY